MGTPSRGGPQITGRLSGSTDYIGDTECCINLFNGSNMKIIKGEIEEGRFRIPYRIYGDSKESIVCICGAQQTITSWSSFVSRFSKEYSVIVFDLPGHGRAKIIDGPPFLTLQEQIDVIHMVVLNIHGSEPMGLASASWGSILGAGYASRYPHMVEKLILGSFGGRPNKKLLETIENGQIMVRENRGDELGHLIIDTFGQRIPDLFKRSIINQFKNMNEEKISVFYANSELIKNVRDINKRFDLSRITAKTLIVNGELDTIINPDDFKFASTQIADCEIRMVPDTGHFLHHENKEILDIYHEFFSMKNAFIER